MSEFEVGDSYYEVLDVSPSASASEIRKAWVKQTKEIHADKTGEDEKYEYLLDAGEVLKDEEKRQAYDVLGHGLFVDRYGRRGNKKNIDSDDLNPETANRRNETSSTSTSNDDSSSEGDTSTSTSTGSRSSSSSRSSTESDRSTGSTGSRSSGETASSSASSQSTGTGSSSSQTSGSTSGTSSRSRTRTGARSGSRSRSRTKQEGSTKQASSTTEKSTSSTSEPGKLDKFKQLLSGALQVALLTPMVLYPVTTRVVSLLLSLAGVWYVAGEIGFAGTGIDFLATIVLTAVLFLTIRWLPDYLGADYPKSSSILSSIPISAVAICMVLATGLLIVGKDPMMDMMGYSLVITAFTAGILVGAALIFGGIGVGLALVAAFGGASREGIGATIFWSVVLGGVFSLFALATTWGQPDEAILDDALELDMYPWPFVDVLPEYIIHGPMIATILIGLFVTFGTLGCLALGALKLFHDPQRHAKQNWHIRPSFWEIGISIPVINLLWVIITDVEIQETPVLGPYIDPILVTESGGIELIWIPALVLVVAFTVKDRIEPRYSNWRD